MRSASTSMVNSASELSKIAQAKAAEGQPTLAARVQARPVMASNVPDPVRAVPVMASPVPDPVKVAPAAAPVYTAPVQRQAPQVARVMARPLMGQAPAATTAQTTLSREEAALILQGLTETLRLADNARTTGWRCTEVDDATFYKGRVLRDRLANYLAFPASTAGTFTITKDEADVADQILGCSSEATAGSTNKTAWIVLGVIMVGAAVFFSVTSRSK
jgi:hypothetical protein